MQTTQASTITLKTRELCQAILDEPDMRVARERIEAFMADEKSRSQYERLVNTSQTLQQKQQRSQQVSGEEISNFERDRDTLMSNPVARGFLEAQEELHHMHESINQYVSKTLELGRVPTEADMDDGHCGHGCGCGHNH